MVTRQFWRLQDLFAHQQENQSAFFVWNSGFSSFILSYLYDTIKQIVSGDSATVPKAGQSRERPDTIFYRSRKHLIPSDMTYLHKSQIKPKMDYCCNIFTLTFSLGSSPNTMIAYIAMILSHSARRPVTL